MWAACLAGAASRTTNPILLALVAAVVGFVVAARRTSAEWSRSLAVFVRLGLVVIVIRVLLQIVFGNRLPGHVIVTLPHVPLPSWAEGVSIGGPVTVEELLGAAVEGMRLAVILICFGAANSLANPYRLLRCLPAVLYEAGVAVTVTLAFVPEVVIALAAVRDARRLRGRPVRGVAGLRGMAVPVLESALERSLQLASSMDARGYGRKSAVPTRIRRLQGGAVAAGLLAVVVGELRHARPRVPPGGRHPLPGSRCRARRSGDGPRGEAVGPDALPAGPLARCRVGRRGVGSGGTRRHGRRRSGRSDRAPTRPLPAHRAHAPAPCDLRCSGRAGSRVRRTEPDRVLGRPTRRDLVRSAPAHGGRGKRGAPVIEFSDVTFSYPDAAPVLRGLDLRIGEGELCLVVGPTGSGKSTLLRAINGLVPHFSGGRLGGEVRVGGRSTRTHPPRELADLIGVVNQNPSASFVSDVVEDELAYTMENLGIAPSAMRRRVEDTLDLLGLHELRHRPLSTLSGGQQQRVAIGAVLTASPRVLVLDEPTSALDPAAAEEVLAALTRLVHDLGMTVVLAEHRLERVVPFADRTVLVPGGGAPPIIGPTEKVLSTSPVAPPIVELARLAGWDPVPLSVRDARRMAGGLRERLATVPRPRRDGTDASQVSPIAVADRVTVDYGAVRALEDVSLELGAGEVVAVMGRNGSGKSTLLARLAGLQSPTGGSVRVQGERPSGLAPGALITKVGLVPQDAGSLLYADSVAEECASADRETGLAPGTTRAKLEAILPGADPGRHPRDLSEGQRLALALAVVLAPEPPLVLLDEPTRGLDYPSKHRLVTLVRALAEAGHCVVVATHDVELVAQVATRGVVLAEGEVVADGPAREVVCHTPVFAPQVAKVLAPDEWLTVDEVAARDRGVRACRLSAGTPRRSGSAHGPRSSSRSPRWSVWSASAGRCSFTPTREPTAPTPGTRRGSSSRSSRSSSRWCSASWPKAASTRRRSRCSESSRRAVPRSGSRAPGSRASNRCSSS